ncbi:3d1bb043-2c08-4b33-9f95-b92178bed6e0 [Thermothielavioides terrestris]|uniref:3d1bb043-2c08-4b33-9f95-b92178bed6e0 n=1 Tax=Thermothielavioides terrestris TaxID=2587410 RepID=A0A446BG36_9PEZI|nr:3d1bb043-2c08-4b33-9f95-b92178bed6e0 [Thermothielavioides terrestris]
MGISEAPADPTSADAVDFSSTNPYSLHKTVHARRSEYVRRHRVRIKVGTWNVAACPGTDKDLARWFVDGEGLDPALGSAEPPNNGGAGGDKDLDGSPDEKPIQLVESGRIGLYVLGLQEVNVLSAPGQYMTWIYAADTAIADKWKAAMEAALPDGFRLIAAEQLAGMLLLAYAAPELAPTISNVSTTTVATGALGYLGNKGAVCARLVLGETTQLLFVNSHLASGVEDYYLERRTNQIQQIVAQARFAPISIAGVSEDEKGKIGDEDFAFWFGDLNFRLDRLPGDDIRRLLLLHTRGEYDLSKPALHRESSLEGEPIVVDSLSSSSDDDVNPELVEPVVEEQAQDKAGDKAAGAVDADEDSLALPDPDEVPPDPHDDPASLQSTLDSLLPHDQLRRLIKERRVLHDGWREGPISFLPTYKYDVGTVALFDSSEKRRPPSWCDRILYRTRRDLEEYQRRVKEEEESRRKDEEMKARGMDEAADDDVLFSYDPDIDGEDQPSSAGVEYDAYDADEDGGGGQLSHHSKEERIRLDLYTSHQRITSSDHKPVSSIFTLDYDAVVPELKAKVHAEVARELDRAENEGRPGITIVVDHHDPRRALRQDNSGSSVHVDFGEIRFLQKETSSLTLANTGRTPAILSFVEKPAGDDSEAEEPSQFQWLTASFVRSEPAEDSSEAFDLGKEVTLEPGETVNAELSALVDDISLARMLNEGQAALEEVLILRVADGRDYFIPVRASWAPTCVGRSVVELIGVPNGGIRPFVKRLSTERGITGSIPYDLPVQQPVPKELLQLTDAIEALTQRALADAQMLEHCAVPEDPGWPFDEATCKSTDTDTRTAHIVAILDALDQDKPIQPTFAPETPSLERLEAVAQTLVLFLRGLTDGIIPAPVWHRIEQAAATSSIPSLAANPNSNSTDSPLQLQDNPTADEDRATILDILQSNPHHNIAFVFLTTTLARVVADLAPLSKTELDLARQDPSSSSSNPSPSSPSSSSSSSAAPGTSARGLGGVLAAGAGAARRGFGFGRRSTNASAAVLEAAAAVGRRRARERRVAEVFAEINSPLQGGCSLSP